MEKKFSNDNPIIISEKLILRNIEIQDSSVLRDLMQRIYAPAYLNYWKDNGEWYVNELYNIENIEKELGKDNADYFFVLYESRVIGIVRIVHGIDTNYRKDKTFVKLHRIYLDQSVQNKGIGYKIMFWLINSSRKKGYKKLWLEVMVRQDQALYFYKKLGFKEVGKVQVQYPLLVDSYRGMYKMVKELSK